MTSPAIKICGITTPDALDAAILARADYAGFNFCERSPRYVAPSEAARLAARAGSEIAQLL